MEQQETKRWKRSCDHARERVKELIKERTEYRIRVYGGGEDSSDSSDLNQRQKSRSSSPIPTISRRSSSSHKSSASSTASHPYAEEPPLSSSSSSSSRRRTSWDSRSSTSSVQTTTLSPLSPDLFPDSDVFPPEPTLPPPLLLPRAELPHLKRSHSAGPVLTSTGVYCEANFPRGGSDQPQLKRDAALRTIRPLPRADRKADRANLLRHMRMHKQISLRPEHIDILYAYADAEFHCQACRYVFVFNFHHCCI